MEFENPIEEKKKSKKGYKIFLLVLLLIIISFILYPKINLYLNELGKTNPEEIINYTQGEFIIVPYPYMSSQDYYNMLVPDEEKKSYSDIKVNYSLETPRLELNYSLGNESQYLDYCTEKGVKINFSNSKSSEFVFNYLNKTFYYRINLYNDLYLFSDNLKNQDCYFSISKYAEGFLKDPYNNNFIDVVSVNFKKLLEMGYSNNEVVEIATLFVQSIPYGTDYTELNRYPYETFYEEEGNCLDKSVILAGILRNLNYTGYILSGKSEGEGHAILGIVCDQGNIQYQGKEICFIETTIFTPISSEVNIEIEEYIQIANGSNVYSEANYGKRLIEYFELGKNNAEEIESKLDQMDLELEEIHGQMCTTDCTYCDETRTDPKYCNDAHEYNHYVGEYNKIVEDYNQLIKNWYFDYYRLEKSMFNNIELVERP